MKSLILLMVVAVITLGSCSVYRTGQTPDDVYYSPAKESAAYVAVDQDRSGRYRGSEYDNPDDRWLRLRVRDPYRWSTFDNYDYYDYRYNSWAYNPYNFYNPYGWNSFWMWNSFYNPYCYRSIYVSPKTNPVAYNRVRNFSLSSYTNTAYGNRNTSRNQGIYRLRPNYSSGYNNNNSNSLGTSIRKVFSSNGNSANNGYSPSGSRPSRTYTPPSSTSSSSSAPRSSSSSSSSGGGGVSRPGRGN